MRKTTLKITKIETANEYYFNLSSSKDNRDFHLSYDKNLGKWILDVFDTTIKDADKAHIDSTEHETVEDGIHEVMDICNSSEKKI